MAEARPVTNTCYLLYVWWEWGKQSQLRPVKVNSGGCKEKRFTGALNMVCAFVHVCVCVRGGYIEEASFARKMNHCLESNGNNFCIISWK